jgi:hypothetical protein
MDEFSKEYLSLVDKQAIYISIPKNYPQVDLPSAISLIKSIKDIPV